MLYFIVNPHSGRGKGAQAGAEIASELDGRGIEYIMKYTEGPGHAIELAREAYGSGYRKIVAVGGDGTMNEVLNGPEGSDYIFGIIPSGTGNDFVRTCGVPMDRMQALELILSGAHRTVDLGTVAGRRFINVAGFGFDVDVSLMAIKLKKRLKGAWTYYLSLFLTLLTLKFRKASITVDGNKRELDYLIVALGNGRVFGGGMPIAPQAEIDDGYLDLCIVRKLPRIKVPYILMKFFKGEHIYSKYCDYLKCREVYVETPITQVLNVDGELITGTPCTFTLDMPIEMFLPEK